MSAFSKQTETFSIDERPRPPRKYATAGYITLRLRVVIFGSCPCTQLHQNQDDDTSSKINQTF